VLHNLLEQFLQLKQADGSPVPKQVLCLGAGFDTTWFQMQADGVQHCRYFEVDFDEVCRELMHLTTNGLMYSAQCSQKW
jgi:tRNA wybutosine-synthesizing protein 4